MSPDARSGWLGWSLLGWILLGAVLFGAVSDLPMPETGARYNIRFLFIAATLVLSALGLLFAARIRRPSRTWVAAGLAYPAWIALHFIPLPRFLVGLVSPERVRSLDVLTASPLASCEGLVDASSATWLTLSADPMASFERFGYVLAAILVCFAARAFSEGERRRGIVLAVVALFAAFEALYGIAQWTSDNPMILWRPKTAYLDVATGTLVNRNHFAQLLYLGMGAALALTLRVRTKAGDPEGRGIALRVTIGLVMGAHLAGIAASQSRAGLGVALLVLLAGALTVSLRRGGARRLETILALVLLIPVVLVAGPALVERLAQVPVEWSGAGSRGAVLRASLAYFADYPLVGSGAGTFAMVFGTYRTPGVEGSYTYAHNDYLQTLLETGAPGLLLALVPIAVFVMGLRREAPARDLVAGSRAPLLAALGGALLHAFVDFGLQIPSNLFLFAFLAGAFGPRSLMAGRSEAERKRLAPVPLALGCVVLMALPLCLLSLARWPGREHALPWPTLAEVHNREAVGLFADSRRADDPASGRALACRALDEQIEAARLVPGNAFYWVGYATRAAAIARLGHVDEDRARELRDSSAAAVEVGRTLDPWNGRSRERLMSVALANGDLGGAIEDARAVARVDKLSSRLVESLLEIGLPPRAVADIVEGEQGGYIALLSELLEDRNDSMLRILVPVDVEATPVRCRAGWIVASVLRWTHDVSGRAFLEACLETPGLVDDAEQRGRLVEYLVVDHRVEGRLDEAEKLLPRLSNPDHLAREIMEIAYLRENWPDTVAAARAYLDTESARKLEGAARARIYQKLAEAQARQGELSDALKSVKRALYFDPTNERVQRWRSDIERGINPFSGR